MNLFFQKIFNTWESNGDKIFIISKEDNLSYKQFINSNHTSIQSKRNKQNSINSKFNLAAIQTNKTLELLSFVWNCWKNDLIPILFNPFWTENEIKNIIVDLNIKYFYKSLNDTDIFRSNNNNFNNKNDNDTAVIIFTSGSSDKPKGVEITFSNLYYSALNGNEYLTQNLSDKWCLSIPAYHIGGFSIFIRSLLFGCTIIIPENFGAKFVYNSILKDKPNFISLVSPQLNYFVENKLKANKELKISLIGGGFIDNNLFSEANNLGWNCAIVYGSTETSSFVTINKNKYYYNNLISVGKVVNETQIEIIDKENNPLPSLNSGEIVISGKSVAKGYFKNEMETKLKFPNGIYYSGDIGFLDKNGYLFIEGKRNDLIVTGGENVNPYEVEKIIKQFNGIKDCAVIPLPDKKWGQIVTAIIETDISIDENKLLIFLKENLASYKIPKKFNYTKSLPRTALGKINREKCMNLINNLSS